MIRRLLLLFTLLTLTVPMMAQFVNVEIFSQAPGQGRMPKSGVTVYSMQGGKKDAERALKKLKDGGALSPADGVKDQMVSQGRMMQMRGSERGFLIVDDGFFFQEVVSCEAHLVARANGNVVEFTIKEVAKASSDEDRFTKKGDVNILGHMTTTVEQVGVASVCKNKVSYDKTLVLDKNLCRDDARYVVVPVMVVLGTDSSYIMPPFALDGEDYHKTMHRRMGFRKDSIDNEQHDTLHRYVIPYRYMHTRQEDKMRVTGVFDKYDANKKYKLMGHVWFEDYNNVYHKDIVTIWDGKPQQPQRYLDWKAAIVDIPVNYTRYARQEFQQTSKHKQNLSLKFEVGKATLNMSDSTTVADLQKIIRALNNVTGNRDSELVGVTVRGYSSPEGSVATNRHLSHARSAEIISRIRNGVTGYVPRIEPIFDSNDNIAPWSRVADVLDSLDTDETRQWADEVRAICERTSSMDQQGREIRGKSYWPFINEKVLPMLRQVIIEYEAAESRIIPADETYQRYQAHEPGYYDGSQLFSYQYYHLLNILAENEDWEGLERVARAAYESSNTELKSLCWKHTRDKRKPIIAPRDSSYTQELKDSFITVTIHKGDTLGYELKHTADYLRPYELATYYLAKCKMRKGEVDTKMLEDYLDDSHSGLENQKRDGSGNLREWWNDEAIALTQVLMYCADDDFEQASKCAFNHLPMDNRFKLFRLMLRAMNCEWSAPEVRDGVAASSPMNACAMYIAQNSQEYYLKADSLLQDTTLFDMNDARVHYLRAICRFHTQCRTANSVNAPLYSSECIFEPIIPGMPVKKTTSTWAEPMLRAFALDESNAEYIKTDGFFNDSYRTLVLYFWERLKQGAQMEDIAEEYDALVAKYRTK